MTNTGYQMALAKHGAKENESIVVNVSIFQLPVFASDKEFLNYVVEGRAAAPKIGRFEIQNNSETLTTLNGAVCVNHHSVSVDNAAKIKNGDTASMLLEERGYNCMHPKDNTVGVNIEYSLRHFPDTSYPSFSENSNEFFKNIRFTEF